VTQIAMNADSIHAVGKTILLSIFSMTLLMKKRSFSRKMNFGKKKNIVLAGLLVAFMLIAAACSTSEPSTTNGSTTSGPTNQTANATLKHVPTGTSDVKWDATSKTLTVTVWLSGLAPKSTHPQHIHKGDCNSDGAVVYTLNPIVADGTGVGTSETTIADVANGIPQSGWYLNVHNGPGLSPDLQATPIACANIANPNASTGSNQSVHLTLGATSAASQGASGSAQLAVVNNQLTVKVTLSGLVPNSTHIAHIHSGSCEAQGAVKYPLNPIVADGQGNGTSITTVDQVTTIPSSGWYVNVHLGGTKDELSTQTGDDPIACGNVVLS